MIKKTSSTFMHMWHCLSAREFDSCSYGCCRKC